MTSHMMNLPYVALGLVRRYLPKQLLFAIMSRRGDGNGAESDPRGYLDSWREQLARHGVRLEGKHILEIGSGRYARLALHMLAAGASRVTLVDLYAVPASQPDHRAWLADDCVELGLDLNEALTRIDLIRGDFASLPPPGPAGCADLAISAAVLEHVYDPELILARCCQWLGPGGLTVHMIDLRDHNMQFRYPFEMLTISDRFWNRWLDLPGGFHLNRWRVPDYLRAAQAAGFERVRYEVSMRDIEGMRAVSPRLDSRFRNIPPELLSILSISLYGEKPSGAL